MNMKCICDHRCVIGEGPIWNAREQKLCFVDGMKYHTTGCGDIFTLDLKTGLWEVRHLPFAAAALAFDTQGRMLVSTEDGVFCLEEDNRRTPIYDTDRYSIRWGNDMKVGPDGRIYVGTQSGKRKGVSDKTDGALYSIDKYGKVRKVLDGLILSNGMEWSMDGKRFYHTDSDTGFIREYDFDAASGTVAPTGRSIFLPGVDGFTMDRQDHILATQWGPGCVAVIETKTMAITKTIPAPTRQTASCGFAGENLDELIVVTASFDPPADGDDGYGKTFSLHWPIGGRAPFLFG